MVTLLYLGFVDFVNNLFICDVDEIIVDDVDLTELNSNCGNDFHFEGVFNGNRGLFNLLIEEDYFDLCVYGDDADEELDFNVDGDDDEEINHHFKDLDLYDLENVKIDGCHHNISFQNSGS